MDEIVCANTAFRYWRCPQGEFNENTHAFYTKWAMASAKRVR
ncbi:hypothetical protein [Collinsella sp. wc0583]